MREAVELPPNYRFIIEAFPAVAETRGVLFAYGSILYNPDNTRMTPALWAHERIHGARQDLHEGGVDGWWQQYITDPKFRLVEEVLSYKAELQVLIGSNGNNRRARRAFTPLIVSKLCHPIYNFKLTREAALKCLGA